jgi:hypothetical protein
MLLLVLSGVGVGKISSSSGVGVGEMSLFPSLNRTFLVDLIFFLRLSMCPIAVASKSGVYLRRRVMDRPGRGGM